MWSCRRLSTLSPLLVCQALQGVPCARQQLVAEVAQVLRTWLLVDLTACLFMVYVGIDSLCLAAHAGVPCALLERQNGCACWCAIR